MAKKIYYRYNPETDNFERVYPSLKSRLKGWAFSLLKASVIAAVLFIIAFYCFKPPTEENLIKENKILRAEVGVLNKRLDNSLGILNNIKDRDNNFYRVILQLDPSSSVQTFPSLQNMDYASLSSMQDKQLLDEINAKMNFLENGLYTQIKSFEELKKTMKEEQDRLAHIPSVIPISLNDYTMSSGYGNRIDPIYGNTRFHEGLDFAAKMGTPVFATADGVIQFASRKTGYGNCIDIDHGYNYKTRYAHLDEILVEEGEPVKRGQLIGKVGTTGKSTGPHLHYEVRFKDEPQNPINYYFMDLSPEEYTAMIQEAENSGHVMD